MSGHSKWATTHRQKAIVDAKRGAVFTKLGNMIAIAARGGVDPTMNPSLALAIEKAKAANMPLANIQRAIDRVADKNAAALEEIVYEGYGPGGVGIIVEVATDNKNRTYPEVRTALTKNGGTMADAGSVLFQFTRKGVIRVAATGEDALLTVLDAGAEDAAEENGGLTVYTEMKDLAKVRTALVDAGLTVEDAELQYVANNDVPVDDKETARKLLKVLDALEDLDDVVNVHTNADITAELDD
jgi:YebC/PmpR family DNA-binding regulatory protein